jgi:hypothetical protein
MLKSHSSVFADVRLIVQLMLNVLLYLCTFPFYVLENLTKSRRYSDLYEENLLLPPTVDTFSFFWGGGLKSSNATNSKLKKTCFISYKCEFYYNATVVFI